jgi:hypothetical protein
LYGFGADHRIVVSRQTHAGVIMANPEHLEVLRQGHESWEGWLKQNPYVLPDLSGLDLSGVDLKAVKLCGASLRRAVLCCADLSGTDLRGADLSGADLRGADLDNADLRGTRLENSHGLTGSQLKAALGDGSTRLPEGLDRPADWAGQNIRPFRRSWALSEDAAAI